MSDARVFRQPTAAAAVEKRCFATARRFEGELRYEEPNKFIETFKGPWEISFLEVNFCGVWGGEVQICYVSVC